MPDWRSRTARLAALSERQLFFVGGAPRSGTTWLQQMLDAHPQISCRGEGLFLNHLSVPLEKLLDARCKVLDEKNRTLFTHTGGFPLPGGDALQHLAGTAILLALDQYGAGPECRAIGEKTPENVFYFPRLLELFPDARFIAIARDPRDVLASAWHFFGKPQGQEIGGFVRAALPSLNAGAHAMVTFAATHPAQTRLVTYEALLHAPGVVLADLYALLGLATDAALVADIVQRSSFASATGGRRAGDTRDGAFHRAGVAGTGAAQLGAELSGLITAEMGWMFPHFGWAA